MTSRVVTIGGKALFRQSASRLSSTPKSSSAMLINQLRSSQQTGIHRLTMASSWNSPSPNTLRFFSDKSAPPPPPPASEGEEKPTEEEAAKPDGAPPTDGEAKEAQEEEASSGSGEPEVSREEQLEKELKQAKDQLLRSLAEQENTRRIAQRDVMEARNFAVKSFAKSLLDVSDNLSRALEVVPENMRKDTENNATLATLYEGIQMTESGLMKAFEMNGLKKFGQPGEIFDPNRHEALYEYPDPEKKPGTVGQVIKVGYLLNDRVLRPAEVGVVKKE